MKIKCDRCKYKEKNPNVFDKEKFRCGACSYRYVDGVGSVSLGPVCIHDNSISDRFKQK